MSLLLIGAGPLAASPSDLKIDLRYDQTDLHVHYDLPCSYGQPSSLKNSAESPQTWSVEVLPKRLPNGLVEISAKVTSEGTRVFEGTVITKLDSPVTLATDEANNHRKLFLRPHGLAAKN